MSERKPLTIAEWREQSGLFLVTHGDEVLSDWAASEAALREHEREAIRRAVEAAKAYQDLATCYRLGRKPTETLFTRLDEAERYLKEQEGKG